MKVKDLEKTRRALEKLTGFPWERDSDVVFLNKRDLSREELRWFMNICQECGMSYEHPHESEKSRWEIKKINSPHILEDMADDEPKRLENGPKAATALSAITGFSWVWDGLFVRTQDPVESKDIGLLSDKVNALHRKGAVSPSAFMVLESDMVPYGVIEEFHLKQLQKILEKHEEKKGKSL